MSARAAVCLGLVFLALASLVKGELHRAKKLKTNGPTPTTQTGPGGQPVARFPPGAFSDYDNEATFVTPTDKDEHTEATLLMGGHSTETWLYSMVSAALVGLSGIFPLLIIPLEAGKALREGAAAAKLKLLLSFAVGGLLGDVFLHLLPEAWAHLDKNGHDHEAHLHLGLWVLAGIFIFLIVEKIFPEEEEDEEDQEKSEEDESSYNTQQVTKISPTSSASNKSRQNSTTIYNLRSRVIKGRNNSENGIKQNGYHTHLNGTANGHGLRNGHATSASPIPAQSPTKKNTDKDTTHIKTSGWLNLLANVVDNFTHGLAVAGSYCVSTKTGLITTVAVLLHEVPHEVGDFAILLRSGFDRWKAAKAQLLTATGGLFGAIVALTAESAEKAGDSTAWVLPFTSGGFIYIALVTVVPDLLKETDLKQSALQVLLVIVGIIMVAGVTLLCE